MGWQNLSYHKTTQNDTSTTRHQVQHESNTSPTVQHPNGLSNMHHGFTRFENHTPERFRRKHPKGKGGSKGASHGSSLDGETSRGCGCRDMRVSDPPSIGHGRHETHAWHWESGGREEGGFNGSNKRAASIEARSLETNHQCLGSK